VQKNTIWVFGDQLNRRIGALREATPSTHRVLLVESEQKIASRKWHVQRAHFIIASMRRFAKELNSVKTETPVEANRRKGHIADEFCQSRNTQ
jgi:deoxyribodipyrimidine photolyase-related protein